MTTRAQIARGTTKEQFEGRVRKWAKQWTPVSDDKRKAETVLKLLKWVQTDERTEQLSGPRHPHIVPVADPRNVPVAPRPKPKPKRGLVLNIKRPAKSTPTTSNPNPDDPTTTTDANEALMLIDQDEEQDSLQGAASTGIAPRPTSSAPAPTEGTSSGPPSRPIGTAPSLKLRLTRPSSTEPPRPPSTDPTNLLARPSSTDPSRPPLAPEPSRPPSADPSRPASTDPSRGASTEPSRPASTDPGDLSPEDQEPMAMEM